MAKFKDLPLVTIKQSWRGACYQAESALHKQQGILKNKTHTSFHNPHFVRAICFFLKCPAFFFSIFPVIPNGARYLWDIMEKMKNKKSCQ
jgi:hypothetical protein